MIRHGVARACARILAAAALAAASLLAVLDGYAAAPKPGLSGTVSVEEGYTDNVRADAVLKESAFFTGLEGEALWRRKPRGWLPHRIEGLVRGRVYSEYSKRDYAEFGPALGYDWDLVALTVGYRYSPNHLRVDPATTVDGFADTHDLPLELRSKFGKNKRWTALLTFDSEWEFYDQPFRGRSFFEETIEAGLRCRATKLVAPRASIAYAHRNADSQNYDREEVELLFGFDLYLPAGIRGLLRYEKTWRNFLVDHAIDPGGGKNNNFGREDDVDLFETGLDVPVPRIDAATFQIRYRYRDNRSSRQDRSYDANEASLRLSYDFE